MVLATHIVTGAAASRLFATHPVQAFFIGWLSHYIFDAVTHWDYPIKSYSSDLSAPEKTKLSFNKYIFIDMGKVILDVLIGFLIILFITKGNFSHYFFIIMAGALGSVVPDFIQFLYGSFKKFPLLKELQSFHHRMHSHKDFNDRPVLGISTQLCLILLAGYLLTMAL